MRAGLLSKIEGNGAYESSIDIIDAIKSSLLFKKTII